MGEPAVNGDKPVSQFISHLTSYPVVHDSISTYQANPYGKKTIELADHGYHTFAVPVLPYFSKPYEYISPYVHKADSLADSGLTKVETRFPIVKKDTATLKGNIVNTATYPFKVANDTKEYVLKTYRDEYKKCGGNGLVAGGKAAVTSSLLITSDSLHWLWEFLGSKQSQVKEKTK